MNDGDEWVGRIGRLVSTVFLIGLGAMFLYGYLGRFVVG